MSPYATMQAINANGTLTTTSRPAIPISLFNLAAAAITETYSNNSVGPTLSFSSSTPSLTGVGNGTATYTAGGTSLTYNRGATHPPAFAPYNAKISLSVSATDSNENVPTPVVGNPGNGTT